MTMVKPNVNSTAQSSATNPLMTRIITVVAVAAVLVIAAVAKGGGERNGSITRRGTLGFTKDAPSKGTRLSSASTTTASISGLQQGSHGGTDYLWQLPDGTPKGIFFVAHGCSHRKEDWWPATENICSECVGLPEERDIVETARAMGLVVVAISSIDRGSGCWSASDGPMVAEALVHIREEIAKIAPGIPIFAFGASSGGSFVAKHLPEAFGGMKRKLGGFICQISASRFRPGDSIPQPLAIPAVFMTMNRDKRTEAAAAETVEAYERANIPSIQIHLPQREILPDFFAQRIPDAYDSKKSADMMKALSDADFLGSDRKLKDDPRHSHWREILKPFADKRDELVPDESPISEVLNVAFAMHEMARDDVKQALEFLVDKQGTSTTK